MTSAGPNFHGLRVAAFESRLAEAMRRLIAEHGGIPVIAPALREVPLDQHPEVFAFAERLFAGQVDCLICLTGVGTRTLATAIATRYPADQFREALGKITVVARGPKPVAALRALGVEQFLTVPEPNTWEEVLALLDARAPVRGKRVAVQEYGVSNTPFLQALEARGAEVSRVPVYRWALPDDTRPVRDVLRAIVQGTVEVALFTNAAQVEHLQLIAAREGIADALRQAFGRLVVGSIGPIASAALRRTGYPVTFEPLHPKMALLVKEAAANAANLLRQPPPRQ